MEEKELLCEKEDYIGHEHICFLELLYSTKNIQKYNTNFEDFCIIRKYAKEKNIKGKKKLEQLRFDCDFCDFCKYLGVVKFFENEIKFTFQKELLDESFITREKNRDFYLEKMIPPTIDKETVLKIDNILNKK